MGPIRKAEVPSLSVPNCSATTDSDERHALTGQVSVGERLKIGWPLNEKIFVVATNQQDHRRSPAGLVKSLDQFAAKFAANQAHN